MSIVWLGLGYLTPYQMIVSCIDYFMVLFPDTQVQYYIAWTYCLANAMGYVPILHIGARFSFDSRIYSSFVVFSVILLLISALVVFDSMKFWVLMVVSPIIGLTDALIQPAIASYASIFPENYIVAFNIGNGISGIVATIIRVITKLLIPSNIKISSLIYFVVGLLISMSCLFVHYFSTRTPYAQKQLSSYHVMVFGNKDIKDSEKELLEYVEEEVKGEGEAGEKEKEKEAIDWRKNKSFNFVGSFKTIPGPAIAIFLNYMITLSIFPGLISSIPTDNFLANDSWFPIFLIASNNIFEFIGKMSPLWSIFNNIEPYMIYLGIVLRILSYPVYILCIKPRLITTPIVPIITVTLMAYSNGLISSLLYILAMKQSPVEMKEDCVSLLSLFLVLGLAVGALVGFGISFAI
uniref:Equilibrative nucleoside transporter 1 n=1 Tax=Arcella intermedia TaxID=1963864 RepID=A0A6B2L5L7_9EUKA